jgi:asparagine synthase (glutamine-hydrolysing)
MRGLKLTAVPSTSAEMYKEFTRRWNIARRVQIMSVLLGTWNFNDEPVNAEFLRRLGRGLVRYGPDGEFIRLDGALGMLYRPFHTTAQSRLEHQPVESVAGNLIVWDGRLDNREELLSELGRDSTYCDQPDAEIASAAFDRWNTDCFRKLVGDWAISIWSPYERSLVLARDYIGVKQLFYYANPNRVLWCNHLAPLVLCGDRFALCDEYIAGYLAFSAEAHLTPYRNVNCVPPGAFVRIRHANLAIHPHSTVNTQLTLRYRTDAEYEEHYRHFFRQAVRRRLRTDSPILADLSGGLDSSAVVCMADNIFSNSQIDTFSLYDTSESEDDDFPYFAKVCQERGKQGFRFDLSGVGDSLSFTYPNFVASPGFGCRKEIGMALSRVLEQREYRVLLVGGSGDEMNGQTLDPRLQMAELVLRLRWSELAKQLIAWSLLIRKRPWIQLLLQTLLELAPPAVRAKSTDYAMFGPWVDSGFAQRNGQACRPIGTKGTWICRPHTQHAENNIAMISRRLTSMEPSPIERRYPYLDQQLVEFLVGVPLSQLLRPGDRRSLMRRALSQILPTEILNRRTKAQSTRYFCRTLDKHWSEIKSAYISPASADYGYIDRDRILEALLKMKNGHFSHYSMGLLNALSLEFWLRDVESRGVICTRPHGAFGKGRPDSHLDTERQAFTSRALG